MAVGMLQDRLARAAAQGERAVTGVVRSWAGAVHQLTATAPDPVVVVRGAYGLAEQVLRVQRDAALDVVRLVSGDDR
jgi:hypothetical protein